MQSIRDATSRPVFETRLCCRRTRVALICVLRTRAADSLRPLQGSGAHGKLGHGDCNDVLQPRRVRGVLEDKHVIAVACAAEHTLCATDDGMVYTWGRGGPYLGQVSALKQLRVF
jgi:hypothetical protein